MAQNRIAVGKSAPIAIEAKSGGIAAPVTPGSCVMINRYSHHSTRSDASAVDAMQYSDEARYQLPLIVSGKIGEKSSRDETINPGEALSVFPMTKGTVFNGRVGSGGTYKKGEFLIPGGSVFVKEKQATIDGNSVLQEFPTTALGFGITNFVYNDSGFILWVLYSHESTLRQFSLSTAWDQSTATHDVDRIFYFGNQSPSPISFAFGNNGDYLYMLSHDTKVVYQYELANAYDIQGHAYTTIGTHNVSNINTDVTDILFSTSGDKMFIGSKSALYEYELQTNWLVNTAPADHNETFNVTALTSTAMGYVFNNTGSDLYILASTEQIVSQVTLNGTWDLSGNLDATGVAQITKDQLRTCGPWIRGISFGSVGDYIVVASHTALRMCRLASVYDLSSFIYILEYTGPGVPENGISGIYMSNEGLDFFVMGRFSSNIYHYTLSAPYDIRSAKIESESTTYLYSEHYYYEEYFGFTISENEMRFFVSTAVPRLMSQFDMTEKLNPLSVTAIADTWTVANGGLSDMTFVNHGEYFLWARYWNLSDVWAYHCRIPYDITKIDGDRFLGKIGSGSIIATENGWSTASDSSAMHVLYEDGSIMRISSSVEGIEKVYAEETDKPTRKTRNVYSFKGVTNSFDGTNRVVISKDGWYMYIIAELAMSVYQIRLDRIWDISTVREIVCIYNLDASGFSQINGLSFSDDGSLLFINDIGSQRFHKFELEVPWMLYPNPTLAQSMNVPISDYHVRLSHDGALILVLSNDDATHSRMLVRNITPYDLPNDFTHDSIENISTTKYSDFLFIEKNNPGDTLFLSHKNGPKIESIDLSGSEYDISNAGIFNIGPDMPGVAMLSVFANPDGRSLYFVYTDDSQSKIGSASMSTAYDASSIGKNNAQYSLVSHATRGSDYFGMCSSRSGEHLYGVTHERGNIFQISGVAEKNTNRTVVLEDTTVDNNSLVLMEAV